jgi:tetratricopeptide (TPR) repeat protein
LANLVLSVREKLISRIILSVAVAAAAALICNRTMVNAGETRGVTHYNIAVNLVAQRGEVERAIRHYAESVRLKPDFAVAHHNLGALLTAQGRMDEAIPELRAALQLRPDYPEAESNLGAALAGQGKLDEARAHFAAAVQLDPDYADAHCNLAVLLAKQGNIAEAISHAQAAVKLHPQSERYLAALEALQKMEPAKEPR